MLICYTKFSLYQSSMPGRNFQKTQTQTQKGKEQGQGQGQVKEEKAQKQKKKYVAKQQVETPKIKDGPNRNYKTKHQLQQEKLSNQVIKEEKQQVKKFQEKRKFMTKDIIIPKCYPPPENIQRMVILGDEVLQSTKDERGYERAPYSMEEGAKNQKKTIQRSQLLFYYEVGFYLERELNHYSDFIDEEIKKQNHMFTGDLISLVKTDLLEKEYSYKSKVVGSYKTELNLPTSDIDVMIDMWVQKGEALARLESIFKTISNKFSKYFAEIKFFTAVEKPFIRLVASDEFQGKSVKIFFEMDGNHARYSEQPILQYLRVYPNLKPMVRIIKIFLTFKGLTNEITDGFNGFSILILVLHSIQVFHRKKRFCLKDYDAPTFAQQFLHFFQYYGFEQHFAGVGLCVRRHDELYDEMIAKSLQTLPPLEKNYLEDMDPEEYKAENSYLYQDKGSIIPQLLLNDIFGQQVISRKFKNVSQFRVACQRALVSLYQNVQCGKKEKCESYNRLKSIERWEEGRHRPCCLMTRLFNS